MGWVSTSGTKLDRDRPTRLTTWPGEEPAESGSETEIEDRDADFIAYVLEDIAADFATRAPRGQDRRIVFRFLASPIEIVGQHQVEGVRLSHNELVAGPADTTAQPTGEHELVQTGLVIRSIGYRGLPLDDLPFDETRGTIPNSQGRVDDAPGIYVTGWIKRGPRGVSAPTEAAPTRPYRPCCAPS